MNSNAQVNYIDNTKRIKVYNKFSKSLNRDVKHTSFSVGFCDDEREYKVLLMELNKDLEEKKHFVFIKRDYALEWRKKTREKISKINSLYTNLSNEIKEAKIDYKIPKKQVKKLEWMRYFEDSKQGNFTGNIEIKEMTHLNN